ncbi:MAG TPA: RHS repeat-associated core domain-containing protein [Opitutaceae bacterium]|nr:RHS repeat-associated core domain-containing protein [Opitutaceae bacterium]
MKPFPHRAVALLAAGLAFALPLRAAHLIPNDDAAILVRVSGNLHVPVHETYSYGSVSGTLNGAGSSGEIHASGGFPGEDAELPAFTVALKANAPYNLGISISSGGEGTTFEGDVTLVSQADYTLYVDGEEKTHFSHGESGGGHSILVRHKNSGLPAGVATDVRVGPTQVFWGVGIGALPSGYPAGMITINEPGYSSALFDRAVLNGSSFTAVVEVINDEDGKLRQVRAPQVLVDIHDITGGYRIDFYNSDAITGFTDGLYTFSGDPFVYYSFVESSGTSLVTRGVGSTVQTSVGTYNDTTGAWGIVAPSSVKTEDVSVEWLGDPHADDGIETTVVKNAAGTPSSKIARRYRLFGDFGDQMIQEVVDPDTKAYTSNYTYQDLVSGGHPFDYGLLKKETHPDGSWARYEYYDNSSGTAPTLHTEYHPWLDAPTSPDDATSSNCRVISYTYQNDWQGNPFLEHERIETINGVTVTKRVTDNDISTQANSRDLWIRTIKDYSDASNYLTTVAKTYHASGDVYDDLTYSVQHPDGTKESYAQIRGTYSTSSHSLTASSTGLDFQEIVFHGISGSTGTAYDTAQGGEAIDPLHLITNQSTKTVTFRHNGWVMRTETHVFTGSGFALVDWTNYAYTDSGKLTQKESSNGALYEAHYTNDFKDWETGPDGSRVDYAPDAIDRVSTATRQDGTYGGTFVTPHVVTTYTYDGSGRVLTAVTTGGAFTQTTTNVYNLAGEMTSQTAPGGYVTTTSNSSDLRTQTVTLPGGATQITSKFIDGRAKSVTGTAVVPTYYSYIAQTSGVITTTQQTGSETAGNSVVSEIDWLNRPVLSLQHNQQDDSTVNDITTTFTYNSLGQLGKKSMDGAAPTLYAYNDLGALVLTALDVNGNDSIDLGGSDRVTQSDTSFYSDGTNWWVKSVQGAYATASSSTATTVQATQTRLTGFASGVQSETISTDINGNTATSTTAVNRSGKLVTTTTTVPDSSTSGVQISYNGYLMSSTSTHGITTTYVYDALGRVSRVVDPRKGGIGTTYYTDTNLVEKTFMDYSGGPDIVHYYYGSDGRVSATADGAGHVTRVAYNNRGQVTNTWGDGTYPVSYAYDSLGRKTSLSTYRGGTGWDGTGWPSSPGTADTTTFAYYGDLGLLKSKTDAASKATGFTYDALGRMATRTDPRGIVTTYSYDANTGERTDEVYSGTASGAAVDHYTSTTNTHYTYNRAGALATVSDVTGTHTYHYRSDLQLDQEQLPSLYGSSRALTYTFATSGVVGRLSGLQLGTTGSPSADQASTYSYTSNGRLDTVGANGSGLTNYAFSYAYTANAEALISAISVASGGSSNGYTQARTYDTHRDALTLLQTKYGSSGSDIVKTQYDYTYNDLGQRITAMQSGFAYAEYGASTFYTYSYNSKGEATGAHAYLGNTVTDVSHPMSGRWYDYGYDTIGNRTSANHTGVDGLKDNYTVNSLNQITGRENNVLSVQGTASSSATVSLRVDSGSSTTAGRAGNHWGTEAYLSNSSGPAFQQLNVSSVLAGAGDGGADLVRTGSRNGYLPPVSESFTYDQNGNLTSDGTWIYSYDAENRLTVMEMNSAARVFAWTGGGRKLTFQYDYLGRRVKKQVFTWDLSLGTWNLERDTRFAYNGWNPVAEMDGSAIVQRHFVWGLDLAGSSTAMGGIGALLMVQDGTGSYLPAYDGGGNVMAMIKASDGSLAATYEYTPYGELLMQKGGYAVANPFRWSTKYTDEETDLVYYGYRYYEPRNGRFINRDPLEEAGGLNLYGFCSNNPVTGWDLLGMLDRPPYAPPALDPDYNLEDLEASYENSLMPVSSAGALWSSPADILRINSMYDYGGEYYQQLQNLSIYGDSHGSTGSSGSSTNQSSSKAGSNSSRKPTTTSKDANKGDPLFIGTTYATLHKNGTLTVDSFDPGTPPEGFDPLELISDHNSITFGSQLSYAFSLDNPYNPLTIANNAARGAVKLIGAAAQTYSYGVDKAVFWAGGSPADAEILKFWGPMALSAGLSNLRWLATQSKTVTVLGSMRDIAPYSNRSGFNVLDVSNVPKVEWSRVNAEWLNQAIVRGDDIWLVTDPVKHTQLMQELGKSSYYLDLELPILEEFNAPAIPKFSTPPPASSLVPH